MSNILPRDLYCKPLPYKLIEAESRGNPRFVVVSRDTNSPIISLSVYESFLSNTRASPNTIRNNLQKIFYFFAWAENIGLDLDVVLCRGESIRPVLIRAFAHWLESLQGKEGKPRLSRKSFNSVLNQVCALKKFFLFQFGVKSDFRDHSLVLAQQLETIETSFRMLRKRDVSREVASDLSDDDIAKVEEFLCPENRRGAKKSIVLRDYIIWRLAIEFGIRIGEILALRVEDCPHRNKDYISIVRIEERGDDYFDPRGAKAPRPKTLSRDLGFIFKNSRLKDLINEYISCYRRRKVAKHGVSSMRMVLEKPDFLLLSHHGDSGNPLAMSSAQNIASKVRDKTGVEFHWHIVRHAFFNRAYSAVIKNSEFDRTMDLVYWGGWKGPQSLQIYINRARAKISQTALIFWQSDNVWEALK